MAHDVQVTGLGQVARTVSDIAQSEVWYRDVLGLEHLFTYGKIAFFDCSGTRLMLSESEDPNPSESLLYFRVRDIVAGYAALLASGVESVQKPHMIHRHDDGTEEWMAFVEDPDGRPIGIMASIVDSESA